MGSGYDDSAIIEEVIRRLADEDGLSRRQAILSVLPEGPHQASNLRRIEMKMTRRNSIVPLGSPRAVDGPAIDARDDPRIVGGLAMSSGILLSAPGMSSEWIGFAVFVGLAMAAACMIGAMATEMASRQDGAKGGKRTEG